MNPKRYLNVLAFLFCLLFGSGISDAFSQELPLPPETLDETKPSEFPAAETQEVSGNQALNNRILGGHLLRRIGFGPTILELDYLTQHGKRGRTNWIIWQIYPEYIDDSALDPLLPAVSLENGDYDHIRRWYVRMTYSQKQLQEKMTLIWHEHFSVSDAKVGYPQFMEEHENLLRSYALGNFRDFLVSITIDHAMLIWLDNNYNNGNDVKPPNENYSREFLQLYSTGPTLLKLDGTPIRDANGNPKPAYSEKDVRELARSMTGWYINYCEPFPDCTGPSVFEPAIHDNRAKKLLGRPIPAKLGQEEVGHVVDVILSERRDTVAAFISKILIQKLATETPSRAYVKRVAREFRKRWDLRAAVWFILTDPEFEDPANVRTQFKEPVEQFIGAVRALDGWTQGEALYQWTYDSAQLVYYPPSVFSFYRPGNKGQLVTNSRALFRDKMADEYSTGWYGTFFDPATMIEHGQLDSPEKAVDYFVDRLIASPIQEEVGNELIQYMEGQITDEKIRGLVWLILCTPDYQRN
ncbi:DUF1800 domain-containing protein [bacterium]|nr:DUF1800 domain-containing protein [bacterium]